MSNMSDRSVQGFAFTGSDRPSRSFGKDRVCGEEGCDTKLSRYNPGKFCYQHEPMAVPRTRGKKIA